MGQIGNLGKMITFEVSSKKVLTFKSLSQTIRGRWTSHNPIGLKPVQEFLGADARSISLTIDLRTSQGVNPAKNLKRIEKAVEKGTPFTFVLGGKKIGKNQWVVTEASESWDTVFANGELLSCSLQLTLAEYVGG